MYIPSSSIPYQINMLDGQRRRVNFLYTSEILCVTGCAAAGRRDDESRQMCTSFPSSHPSHIQQEPRAVESQLKRESPMQQHRKRIETGNIYKVELTVRLLFYMASQPVSSRSEEEGIHSNRHI